MHQIKFSTTGTNSVVYWRQKNTKQICLKNKVFYVTKGNFVKNSPKALFLGLILTHKPYRCQGISRKKSLFYKDFLRLTTPKTML